MGRRTKTVSEVPNRLDTSLLRALEDLGFSETESRALLALALRARPTPLAAVSRDAGLPRSTAHSALQSLATRGIIFCEGRYPTRFRAAPVSRLSSLAARLAERARRAAAAAELLRAALHF